MIFRLVFIVITFLLFSCQKEKQFTKIDYSGIVFENSLDYTENLNPYTYRNFYNGAGVAMGDINNDGLIDVYLTGNIVDSKMFLNKGDFKFEDITKTAGLACENVWSTGSTFADINGDGFLDLYVCKSGSPDGEKRYNELFINNGDLTFTESSKEYNLDILGLSVQSAFFDYDKDGDLDCYILNNSLRSVGGYDLIENQRLIPDSQGNKLLENREGKFIDVSEQSGIYTSKIGFGLGITLSDYNEDGWTDLFISNDFFEKDYMYINNQDGTFSEKSEEYFHSLSLGSMGADSADLNNDLLTDLIVTEMLPKSLERKKTKAIYDSFDKYQRALSKGYYHQFPRNVLQRNYGKDGFLEIGRYSGISATEWSWASMIFDMNNDGLRDVFIANGIYKDLLDRDYLSYMANEERVRNLIKTEKEVIKKLIDVMPSQSVSNIAYENMGDFNFIDASVKWGLDQLSFSNGTAYADLDNDGDLDMVVNNVNMPVFVYKNNNDNFKRKSISFNLTGEKSNLNAIGSKIILKYGKTKQSMSENFPSRGFQSSIS
ncbi:MAG: VCBS repeat-containing protein, partial [Flavobacteriaceae bacterium]|nr:VCBS repeat-containing protein [Flavobacteriaceae bacterium]